MGRKAKAAAQAGTIRRPSRGARDARRHHQCDHPGRRHQERAVEQVVVAREPLQQQEPGGPPGVASRPRLEQRQQVQQHERQEAVEQDLEPRRLVDLVGVERVERPRHERGPGGQAQPEGQGTRGHRGQQAAQEHRDVVGEHGVSGRPDHGRDQQRRQQLVLRQRAGVRSGVQDVLVERMQRVRDQLVRVPADQVHAGQRVADVADRVAWPQALRPEGRDRPRGVECESQDAPRRPERIGVRKRDGGRREWLPAQVRPSGT